LDRKYPKIASYYQIEDESLKKRLPAEWEEQDSVIVVFPHENSDWGDDLNSAESVFLRIISSISFSQKVIAVCKDREKLKSMLCYHDRISFIEYESDDTWVRDFGPISIEVDKKRELLDFTFNGWGGKFDAKKDNLLSKHLHKNYLFYPSPLIEVNMVLEGGSIESDGDGTLLTTSKCLLNPNRNPNLSKDEIEENLKKHLGVKRILWLENGELEGDDTDAHVDTLVRFVDRDTLVYVKCYDKSDSHYEELKEMEKELESFKTLDNKPYNLIPLPLPSPIYKDGKRLPATYANFLITNSAVLVPVYNDSYDKEVIELFRGVFKDREIIPINSLRLIEEGGSIHCSTMQIYKKV
jgi:agmatine deiminase